ncbi:hypothetical protein U1Q18_052129 [Sarracenia purpurea var. burkii]
MSKSEERAATVELSGESECNGYPPNTADLLSSDYSSTFGVGGSSSQWALLANIGSQFDGTPPQIDIDGSAAAMLEAIDCIVPSVEDEQVSTMLGHDQEGVV